MKTTTYLVVSPEMEFYGGGYEPNEFGSCVVEIDAPSKRQAIVEALRSNEFREWVRDQRGDNKNPFTGVVALPLDSIGSEW